MHLELVLALYHSQPDNATFDFFDTVHENHHLQFATMLALRDQENLVNTHQTAAAAKPLNQSKQLAPKTPGKPRNDENNPLAFGNRTVKGNGNRQDNGKPGNNAFMTPMGTRCFAKIRDLEMTVG